MTPMIDVVFLLLIFFVCTSVGQIRESLLPAELAGGSIASAEPVEQLDPLGDIWIGLKREGDATLFELNSIEHRDWVALKSVLMELAEVAPEMPVILDTAADVPFGDVIAVYDTCRAAGFDQIDFATDPQ